MFKKSVLAGMLLVAALSVSAIGIAAADGGDKEDAPLVQVWDDEMGWVAVFGDGRINHVDMTASTVAYYDTAPQLITNDEGETVWQDVIVGLELWTVDPDTSVGQLALYVPVSAIEAAMGAAGEVQVAAGNGVALTYAPDTDAFTLTGPNGYTFTWSCW